MNVCNFKDSNACVTFADFFFLFSRSHKIHNFHGMKYKSNINKAMFMHIFNMTLNKLNNVHNFVFCSDNA